MGELFKNKFSMFFWSQVKYKKDILREIQNTCQKNCSSASQQRI